MNEVLMEGLSLMCIGMGTVLTFLCIMIVAMIFMSMAVKRLNIIFPEPVEAISGGKKVSASNDDEVVAAIAVAMFGKR